MPTTVRALLWKNADFRKLWAGDVISLLGDWFNTLALYELITRLTGSPLALGIVFITKMLPFALASPIAGLLSDRLNRKYLMVGADLFRAVVVLGFLLVDTPGEVYLIYLLTAFQVIATAFFTPARNALLPTITVEKELLTANALMAATWSVQLAIGAALGGIVTAWIGIRAVFVINSLTYVASAYLIARIQRVHPPLPAPSHHHPIRQALRDILEGWRFLLQHPAIGQVASAKAAWALGGGALVYMLALLGQQLTPEAPSMGMGLLYAARGVGTGIGPLLARRWFQNEAHWPYIMGTSMLISGIAYFGASYFSSLWLLALLILLAHATSGANWVLSTVYLQKHVPNQMQGRIFSSEWLIMTTINALSILLASLTLEQQLFSLNQNIQAFALLEVIIALLWLFWTLPTHRFAKNL